MLSCADKQLPGLYSGTATEVRDDLVHWRKFWSLFEVSHKVHETGIALKL
jgi:hypothetical protein